LAFVGGRSVGKTYLFQALVKQLMDVENAGALSYFIKDPVRLFRKAVGEDVFSSTNEYDYIQNYEKWVRLDPTQIAAQNSYQLRVPIRTGWLGKTIKHMYVEYFDGAGERLAGGDEIAVTTWFHNYADAEVMVFCLPFWAAFPTSEYDDSPLMSEAYKEELQETIKSFDTIVKNYVDMRQIKGIKTKVKCVVALTQADQIKHTTLGQELADSWLLPFKLELEREEHEIIDQVDEYRRGLSTGKGVNLYLENARNLSDILRQKIKRNKAINRSLSLLDFGSGEPWLIPMSAISGHDLDRVAQGGTPPMHSPIPAHVELPLLVALSQYCNALM
jgi:GTPase SAR1 family protein